MLTRQDVLAHQGRVPWPSLRQVEQDLLLSRSMVAIFGDSFLQSELAMRGGTVLHKVHLAPAARYSEDIDLVAVGKRPAEHIRAGLKRVLQPVLGKHKRDVWDEVKLAVRNAARPSRILRLTYEVVPVAEPGPPLALVVEANVTERTPYRPVIERAFAVPFRGSVLAAQVRSFELDEMLVTKLRALFQRRRGRDLFDLYWALRDEAGLQVAPARIIASFQHYLRKEGGRARRTAFLRRFDAHLADGGFLRDMETLLRAGLDYDPRAAGALVRERLLSLLPA
jgi:predicted nucleotidyltransferase component of viral defense system